MSSRKPIMGWSSWNHFRTEITEKMIKGQADAMLDSGLKEAGYSFINIDDGYFGGRNENGILHEDRSKFPSGMKALTEYIHSKGLKAGIYSDAGSNTCASVTRRDNFDPNGRGTGLLGHDRDDLNLFFSDWNYDFLKVDWCGGFRKRLCAERRYTEISRLVREIAPQAVFNVCCWKFPGAWVTGVADSWRISGDIIPEFGPAFLPGRILHIIEKNAGLAGYAGPGHYNDMDMLQVGRGMTEDEDKAHFSMWCMMSSPLLAGNDLRQMSDATIAILTNRDLIAVNQDELGLQAGRVKKGFGLQIWKKSLQGGKTALAVLNTINRRREVKIKLGNWFKDGSVKECWSGEEIRVRPAVEMTVAAHGILVFTDK